MGRSQSRLDRFHNIASLSYQLWFCFFSLFYQLWSCFFFSYQLWSSFFSLSYQLSSGTGIFSSPSQLALVQFHLRLIPALVLIFSALTSFGFSLFILRLTLVLASSFLPLNYLSLTSFPWFLLHILYVCKSPLSSVHTCRKLWLTLLPCRRRQTQSGASTTRQ